MTQTVNSAYPIYLEFEFKSFFPPLSSKPITIKITNSYISEPPKDKSDE